MSREEADRAMVEEKKKNDKEKDDKEENRKQEDGKEKDDAAVKIQAMQRGKTARKEVEAMAVPEAASNDERISNLFDRFDLDKSNSIDLAELTDFISDEGVAITIMDQIKPGRRHGDAFLP